MLTIIWLILSVGLISWFAYSLLESDDKTIFMPGQLTDGHHQIGVACSSCHSDSFSDKEAIQEACTSCHGDDRQKPFDSHPRGKFTGPRNADTLENINAQLCVTCHTEHQPEMTGPNGLTQPSDFCIHCHEDIGEERPSHKEMEFNTCNSSGCHNFHNNRSIYTDFLIKHRNEPDVLEKRTLPEREFGSILGELADYPHDRFPVKQLAATDADAPQASQLIGNDFKDWLETAHARSGVNCSACHTSDKGDGNKPVWVNKPAADTCNQCHNVEAERFKRGKHGMRLAVDLPPMTPGEARLPMKKDSFNHELGCTSCHASHRFDVQEAAVNRCLECHDDKHSLAYKDSPHYDAWQRELDGEASPGGGVSCASCHMPRVNFDVNDWVSRIMVDHNQNATLSPNEKMIRPACLNCHGLGFSLDALADPTLIENNFNGKPSVKVDSMRLADEEQKRADSRDR